MPHLSPMQWTMMIISTWLLTLMISTMIFFPMQKQSNMNPIFKKKKNNWHMYSSMNKL